MKCRLEAKNIKPAARYVRSYVRTYVLRDNRHIRMDGWISLVLSPSELNFLYELQNATAETVSYTHLTLPTTPYV